MKIIKNTWFPFGNYVAINMFGVVFTKRELDEVSINHEKIHTKQMQEMLWIGFYIWYILEYFILWFARLRDKQSTKYHDISLEEEAHNNDTNLNYINTRKHYTWLKYLKIGSYDKRK